MSDRSKKQTKVALVTGAGRRIGAAIAQHLHRAGFRLIIHYHHSKAEALALTQAMNQTRADSALALTADFMIKSSTTQLVTKTLNWAGKLDLLVNNASLFKRTNLADLNESDWEPLFTINVKAPFWLSHTAYPHLAKHSGSIINITDIHAHKPLKQYALYCQTKAALAMQTKALALEFAPNVRVNAIAPGAIAWPEGENALKDTTRQAIIEKTPLKRHGSPIFIAQAVLTLAENPFITGTTIKVDGGRALV